jgi:peptidyl-dipeptidase A
MKKLILGLTVLFLVITISCTSKQEKMENRMRNFISDFETKVIPLYIRQATTSWNANITGKNSDLALSEKASFEYTKVFTDSEAFNELKELKESGAVLDPLLARQLDMLYDAYLGNQVDTSLISRRLKMETDINRKYLNFRANVNGKELTDNQIDNILRHSTRSSELRAAWEGHKMIGPIVAEDIINLVKHRNLIARQLGFSNYHEMSLKLSGQDPAEVTSIFDELDNLTRDNFAGLKNDIDAYLSKLYRINTTELRPWYYQNRFFQEAPDIYPVDLDKYYAVQDPVKLEM